MDERRRGGGRGLGRMATSILVQGHKMGLGNLRPGARGFARTDVAARVPSAREGDDLGSMRRVTTMRRGHLPGHEPLGVLRVPLLLASLPGHERGWLARRVRRHRRWGFHRGRRRVRRRGRSATGVVHAGHASRSSRCVTTDVQRLIAGVACPRTRAFPTDCAPPVWTDGVGPSWMNFPTRCGPPETRARSRVEAPVSERTRVLDPRRSRRDARDVRAAFWMRDRL